MYVRKLKKNKKTKNYGDFKKKLGNLPNLLQLCIFKAKNMVPKVYQSYVLVLSMSSRYAIKILF